MQQRRPNAAKNKKIKNKLIKKLFSRESILEYAFGLNYNLKKKSNVL